MYLISPSLPCLTSRSGEPVEFLDETYSAKTRGIYGYRIVKILNFNRFD